MDKMIRARRLRREEHVTCVGGKEKCTQDFGGKARRTMTTKKI
jgi:hypothetical protein